MLFTNNKVKNHHFNEWTMKGALIFTITENLILRIANLITDHIFFSNPEPDQIIKNLK